MVEKNSLPLFLEDIYDALRAVTQAAGGPKVVAARLWSTKPIDQGRRDLLDALNRDNPRKLDPEEVMEVLRIGREIGFHQAKHWIDVTLGYDATPPADPAIERDRLADELAKAAANFERLQQMVERLTKPQLQAVR